jgi:hypothetical protein
MKTRVKGLASFFVSAAPFVTKIYYESHKRRGFQMDKEEGK